MEWTPVFDFLSTLAPWVIYLLTGLGSLVVIGMVVDASIPDEYDRGFMKKVLGIPVVGDLLRALSKFSPFHLEEKK